MRSSVDNHLTAAAKFDGIAEYPLKEFPNIFVQFIWINDVFGADDELAKYAENWKEDTAAIFIGF
jgi:hypothetical protein